MAKYNIDDILSQLGVDDMVRRRAGERPPRAFARTRRRASKSSSVTALTRRRLPSLRSRPCPPTSGPSERPRPRVADPAVKVPVRASSAPSIGPAISEIYKPLDTIDGPGPELGALLLSRKVITAERLTSAEQVIKATPGKRLADILIEQGVDEAGVIAAVAELAGIPLSASTSPRAWTVALTPSSCSA